MQEQPRNATGALTGRTWWAWALWTLYMFLVVRTAWVSDDALITARVMENFVHGYGPVFNVDERVQVYTHPLWFLLLSALYRLALWVFRPQHAAFVVFFLIGVSLVVSGGAMALLLHRVLRRPHSLLLGGMALLLSRGFIDYSTSGLEYPLLSLLLTLWVWRFRTARHDRRVAELTLWLALLMTTRMDAGLLVLPLWFWDVLRTPLPWRARWKQILLGWLPLLLWEAFAIVYYGFPFPNTYYAKLAGTGMPLPYRVYRGFIYILHTWDRDPVTMFTIGLVLVFVSVLTVAALRGRGQVEAHLVAGAVGLLLYLGYVLYTGGDFMLSRFLVPPLVWAVLLWDDLPWPREYVWHLAGVFLLLGYSALYTVLRPQGLLVIPQELREQVIFDKGAGVADERLYFFFNSTGQALIRIPPLFKPKHHPGNWRYDPQKHRVVVRLTLGENGYAFGPSVHLIDEYALADPLLARLPAIGKGVGLRPGHMARYIPAGYLKALETGDPAYIRDPQVRAYYQVLLKVVRGPLFTRERWQAMLDLYLGRVRPPEKYERAPQEEVEQYRY